MSKITFSLNISQQEYLRYYQGVARQVIIESHNGQRIQFPAGLLRQFVSHQGITGSFEMEYDDDYKCIGISRVD